MNAQNGLIRVGDLTVDRQAQQVRRGPLEIKLPGLSFRLLDALAQRFPEPVPRRELASKVWGQTLVSDATVRQRVRLLRKALGNPEYVVSVKGLGYRLARREGPVSPASHLNPRAWKPAAWVITCGMLLTLAWLLQGDGWHVLKHAVRHGVG